MKVELSIDLKTQKFYVTLDGKEYYGTKQDALFTLLAENTITKVTLSGYSANPELFMSIVKLISSSKSINAVDISGNGLKAHGPEVAQELVKCQSLQSIDMTNNGLKEYGSAVAQVLAKSTSLHTVIMADNWLKEHGQEVAQALIGSQYILAIDISSNLLKGNGIAVAQALAKSATMNEVNMSHNGLKEHGPKVAQELAKSKSLRSVDIQDNGVSDSEKQLVIAQWDTNSDHSSAADISALGTDKAPGLLGVAEPHVEIHV